MEEKNICSLFPEILTPPYLTGRIIVHCASAVKRSQLIEGRSILAVDRAVLMMNRNAEDHERERDGECMAG